MRGERKTGRDSGGALKIMKSSDFSLRNGMLWEGFMQTNPVTTLAFGRSPDWWPGIRSRCKNHWEAVARSRQEVMVV